MEMERVGEVAGVEKQASVMAAVVVVAADD